MKVEESARKSNRVKPSSTLKKLDLMKTATDSQTWAYNLLLVGGE